MFIQVTEAVLPAFPNPIHSLLARGNSLRLSGCSLIFHWQQTVTPALLRGEHWQQVFPRIFNRATAYCDGHCMPTHDNLRHGTAILNFLYLPVRSQDTPSDRASASSRLKWTQWCSCTIESHYASITGGLPETFISSNNIRRTLVWRSKHLNWVSVLYLYHRPSIRQG
jgi:hypothetical protein